MKICVLFEGSPKNPGGFYQNLNSAILLNKIHDKRFEIEFLVIEDEAYSILKEKKLKVNIFKRSIKFKLFNLFLNFNFFEKLVTNFNIKHPFSNFLNKNKYKLIIFLSPHNLALYSEPINFIINIWDIDHKKNSIFKEHRENKNYLKRERYLNYILFHSYKTIVADEKTKNDLVNIYGGLKENIVVQPFIPLLPKIYEKNQNFDFTQCFNKFNVPKKKILLYPATFWEHKNHKYLIDVAKKFKSLKKNDYIFLFCGNDKGFLSTIEKTIEKHDLSSSIKILKSINDFEMISLYLSSFAIVMPTTGGPTNLPIYESFYFKKPIFYSNNLLDSEDEINNYIYGIDPKNPEDFIKKLEDFSKDNNEQKLNEAFNFYHKICSEEGYKKNYSNLLNEYFEKKLI